MGDQQVFLVGIGLSGDLRIVEKLAGGAGVGVAHLEIRENEALANLFNSRRLQHEDEYYRILRQRAISDSRTQTNLDRISLIIIASCFLVLLVGILAVVLTRDASAKVNVGIVTALSTAMGASFQVMIMGMQKQLRERRDRDKLGQHVTLKEAGQQEPRSIE